MIRVRSPREEEGSPVVQASPRALETGREGSADTPAPSRLFARGIWRLAAANVTAGNRVRLLHDGPESFGAMVRAIEEARDCVALESYIVRDDAVGLRFASALAAAAARGVHVRLLADWLGSRGTSRQFWEWLRAAGVEVRLFNRMGWRRWLGIVPRDHRKQLVADERIGVTGGFGLGEEWDPGHPLSGPPRHWRDTAVHVEGPAVVDMRRAFDTMWRRAGPPRSSEPGWIERREQLRPHAAPSEGALVGIIEGEPWRLRIARGLQVQSVLADRSIWIATAYFFPSFVEIEGLTGAARDGVDVRLLLPSKNDHPWVTRLARRFYPGLLRSGVRIWEWGGPMMHAKTSVVDGRWVRVGSTDLNPLGFGVNYELDAIIEDDELGRDADAMFLGDLERSREITRVAGRSIPGKTRGEAMTMENRRSIAALGDVERKDHLERVVIAVDFHESSRDAAVWTVRHFAPEAAHELVHVVDLPELPGPLRGLGTNREQLRLAAREGAERRLDELRQSGAGSRVQAHVRDGRPAAEIVRLAEEVGADLVIVGEQGQRRGVGALLGSTAERVLFDSRIPVLLARKVPDAPPRRLLVAIDDSEMSHQVLAWASNLLRRFDATATVLNVIDRVLLADELTGLPDAEALRQLEREATTAMQKWLEDTIREAGLPESRAQRKVAVGEPSYEIIAEAAQADADLVLIGSRGGDVARSPLIGRIVNKVVRNAPCSVLVVTNRERPG